MPRIGVVGTKGGWSSEMLADRVGEATGYRLLVEMDRVRLDLETGRAWFEGVDLSELDALMVKKVGTRYSPDLLDRLEVLRFLASRGLPVFSKPSSMLRTVDRLSCTVTLKLAGVPMPPTTITEDVDEALAALESYGEAVFKPLYSSKARGMRLIQAGPGARAEVEEHRRENHIIYIQKRIDLRGRDLGVAFLGGKYLATYARCNRGGAWNTTTASGGRYEPYEPPGEIIDLARRAQSLFDLDFTCVDVAEEDDGPVIFEVSAFGGFRGLLDACNVDAAGLYIEHVLSRIGA